MREAKKCDHSVHSPDCGCVKGFSYDSNPDVTIAPKEARAADGGKIGGFNHAYEIWFWFVKDKQTHLSSFSDLEDESFKKDFTDEVMGQYARVSNIDTTGDPPSKRLFIDTDGKLYLLSSDELDNSIIAILDWISGKANRINLVLNRHYRVFSEYHRAKNEKAVEEPEEDTIGPDACMVCYSAPSRGKMFNCGHCACIRCAEVLSNCPKCRKRITSRTLMFCG